MFQNFINFIGLFGNKLINKIRQADQKIDANYLKDIFETTSSYLTGFGSEHCPPIDEIINRLKNSYAGSYALSIDELELPKNLMGIFVPCKNNVGKIILNSEHNREMHVSTLGHEYGHMMLHFYNCLTNPNITSQQSFRVYAKEDSVYDNLDDPEELIADYFMAIGAYPLEPFREAFCNKQNEVLWIYKTFTPLLFIRAFIYLAKYFPHLKSSFPRANHKFYHISMVLYCIRLRVYLYEKIRQ